MKGSKYGLVIGIILLVGLFIITPSVYPQEATSQAEQIIEQLPQKKDSAYWSEVTRLEALGKDALPAIERGLISPSFPVRLACARAIYHLERQTDSINTLLRIIKESSESNYQINATEIITHLVKNGPAYIDKESLGEELETLLDNTANPYLKIHLAKALYQVTGNIHAIRELKSLLKTNDVDLKRQAAIALGALEHFELVQDILKEIAREPTEQGQLARLYLEHKRLQDAYLRKNVNSGSRFDYSLIEEILLRIQKSYVDPEKFDLDKLLEAAAKGLMGSLDRFSGYQDIETKKRSEESMRGSYGGIGAYVNMRDNVLTIERPIYGGPVYKVGIRSFDKITQIEGESTRNQDLNLLVKKLKGVPGTPVKVMVFRRGWQSEREFTLIRAIIKVKTARAEMLPGKIGFLSLTSFGARTTAEMRKCLEELKAQDMQVLIIDLRNNPGGLLRTAVETVDLLFKRNKLIVSIRDKDGNIANEHYTRNNNHVECPIYVLINGSSASASEILSGVIQDYKKGILIGETTYGKGSVQNIFPLNTTNRETALRLTIAKYYLPSGRCIHKDQDTGEGGVKPDIEVTVPERDLWKDYEFNRILDTAELDNYLDTEYTKNKTLFNELVLDDGLEYRRYPNFDTLYNRLKTHLNKNETREILRQHLRRRVADERGREFLTDIQYDIYLQRAIIEALTKLEIDPTTIPAYKPFADKFDQAKAE